MEMLQAALGMPIQHAADGATCIFSLHLLHETFYKYSLYV